MKLLRYVVGGFIVTAALTRITVRMGHVSLMAIAFVVLFVIPPLGALWMEYRSIRCEKRPLPLVLFALFVAFSLLWYYLERGRLGKVTESHSPA